MSSWFQLIVLNVIDWGMVMHLCIHVQCASVTLQWRHNGRDSVSIHQPHDCFLNHLFRHRSKKTSKLHVTGLCAGNLPEADEFPTQMTSNAENVSIWWRHHELMNIHGSGNGLSSYWQVIASTNTDSLLTGPLGTKYFEIWIQIHKLSRNKTHLNI